MKNIILTFLLLVATPSLVVAGADIEAADSSFIQFNSSAMRGINYNVPFTMWAVLKLDSTTQNSVIVWQDAGGDSRFNYGFRSSSTIIGGQICVSTVGCWATANFTYTVDDIMRLVVTYTGTHTDNPDMELFVDGTSIGTGDYQGGVSTASNGNFMIGATSSSNQGGDATLYEVAVWDIVLTDAEIDLLSDAQTRLMPLQIQPGNLQLYATMDDEPDGSSCTGDTFIDRSDNQTNGSGNGTCSARSERILTYP